MPEPFVLLFGGACLLVAVGALQLAWRARRLGAAMADMERRVAELTAAVPAQAQQVALLSSQVQALTGRIERLDHRAPTSHSFHRAMDLARRGATAADLTERCALSPGEADLVVNLYGGTGAHRAA